VKPSGLQSQSLVLLAAVTLCGCEAHDSALQQELAELRQQARSASEEAAAATSRLAQLEIQSADALAASLKEAARPLEKDLATAFPGYRPEAIRHGRFIFLIGESRSPYRTTLEFTLKPTSPSALTPDMPPVSLEIAADPHGSWTMPGQPRLRELQAAASAAASAAAQTQQSARHQPTPQQAPPQTQPPRQQPPPAQPPTDPNTRVISWGDPPAQPAPPQQPAAPQNPPAQQQPPAQPAPQQPAAPGNAPGLPKADRTYEIRFD
jgi:hypothetical protein